MSDDKKCYEYNIANSNQQIIISYVLGTLILIVVCFIPFLFPVGLIIGLGLIMDISKQKKLIESAKDGLSRINE